MLYEVITLLRNLNWRGRRFCADAHSSASLWELQPFTLLVDSSSVITSYSIHYTKLYDPEIASLIPKLVRIISVVRRIINGKMPAREKESSMRLFRNGHAQILVATTVIEVGVDIPNATVMVIESAERFRITSYNVCYTKLLRDVWEPGSLQ